MVIKKVGLGEGSALPVGVPIPWPSATPPTGWLKCNGAAFTASQYPKLALAYPTFRLPDLRGEFIRGWDDGRGVDNGRALLSAQDDMFRSHYHQPLGVCVSSTNTAGTENHGVSATYAQLNTRQVANVSNTGGVETRPRNIAFNYIVRAA